MGLLYPGFELCSADRLNLLQIAPGGYMCFCNCPQTALAVIYSAASKTIYEELMANTDLSESVDAQFFPV